VFYGIAGALGMQQAPEMAEYMHYTLAAMVALVPVVGCGKAGKGKVAQTVSVCKRRGAVAPKASFAAGTMVLTRSGLKPIEDIEVGELLAARDPATGAVHWQPVRARLIRGAAQVMRLTVRDEAGRIETVVVTPNHPYLRADGTVDILRAVSLDPGGLWTAAGYLKAGDKLDSVNGQLVEVVRVEVDSTTTTVYNLEVAEDHTYAVGELQAWVHNATNVHHIIPKKVQEKLNPAVAAYANTFLAVLDECYHKSLHKGGTGPWVGRGGMYSQTVNTLLDRTATKADVDRVVRIVRRRFGF
jgi:hypothetical protein